VGEGSRGASAEGYSARGLSIAAGLNPTAVRDILIGRSKTPRFQTLYRLAEVLGCRVEELTDPNAALPEWPLADAPDRRPRYRPTAGPGGVRGGPDRRGRDQGSARVPRLDLDAIEDGLAESQWDIGELGLPRDFLDHLGCAEPVILTVRGDEMSPTLNPRDLVLVDRAVRRPRRDGIYVLVRPGQVSFRRLRQDPRRETVTLLADNPVYPAIADVPLSEIEIFGLVVWQGRAL